MCKTLPVDTSTLVERAIAWRDADPDPTTRAELTTLVDNRDTEGIRQRFDGSLHFGTAGIRAELGAGPLRVNRLVIARVSTGLARYIQARDPRAAHTGVVVGYDGRTSSAIFAADAARTLARSGITVWLLPRALPTPVLAFAVRHLRAGYGLMVTASHNPRGENGLKVYVSDGGQLLAPVDVEISAFIDAVDPVALPDGWADGPFPLRNAEHVADAYVSAIAAGAERPTSPPFLRVVHTALHGVGSGPLRAVLTRAGWPAPVPVTEQEQPDPAFPTTPYPNPEEPGVLDLAQATAVREGADLVLANDPDADRLAVVVRSPDGWHTLSGDELGALLGDAVLRRLGTNHPIDGPRGMPAIVATTVVSSSLLRRMASAAGVRCVTTLTGFKWIVRAAGPGARLVYGYEEALGYALRPSLVADKDGISAALVVVELAEAAARDGRTLLDHLDDLAIAHGLHITRQRSIRASRPGKTDELAQAMQRARREPPERLAGRMVTVSDLLGSDPGPVDLAGGRAERSPGRPIEPADVLIWHAGADARVVLRPSGTEPKLKMYIEVMCPVGPRSEISAARAKTSALVDHLVNEATASLGLDQAPGAWAPTGTLSMSMRPQS